MRVDGRCLELARFPAHRLSWGEVTAWRDGELTVDRNGLLAALAGESRARVADVQLLSPGEPARLVDVLDVIEPRAKVAGPGEVFPGVVGGVDTVGEGRTHRLDGVAVVVCGRFADEGDELRNPQVSSLDLSGPGAVWTPYAALRLVALHLEPEPGSGNAAFDEAVRRVGCLAARYLAGCTREAEPPEVDAFRFDGGDPRLPAVAQVVFLPTFGRLMECRIYGEGAGGILPMPLHPGELADGAVVCGEYHYAGQRSLTHAFQLNAPGAVLARRHGRDLRYAGVVLSRIHMTHAAKERAARMTAAQLRLLGADAAVISAAAAGNAHIDAMFTARACEAFGIRAAVIQVEMSSPAGDDPPLVDFVPEADLIISTGNREELIALPEMPRVFGGPADEGRARLVPLRDICGSSVQLGGGRLTARGA